MKPFNFQEVNHDDISNDAKEKLEKILQLLRSNVHAT